MDLSYRMAAEYFKNVARIRPLNDDVGSIFLPDWPSPAYIGVSRLVSLLGREFNA